MTIDAFILIGGHSTRFGSPKALVPFGGESLLQRTAETIKTALPEARITLVTSGPEQFLGLNTDLPFIFDIHQGRGPLGGLHAALAYAQTDWIFVTACDYPFISPELIQHLEREAANEYDAVVPIQPDEKLQPLCAFYRAKPCLAIAEEFLTNNRPSPPLRSILDRVRARLVPFDDIADLPNAENFFLNLNTPENLELAARIERNTKNTL